MAPYRWPLVSTPVGVAPTVVLRRESLPTYCAEPSRPGWAPDEDCIEFITQDGKFDFAAPQPTGAPAGTSRSSWALTTIARPPQISARPPYTAIGGA